MDVYHFLLFQMSTLMPNALNSECQETMTAHIFLIRKWQKCHPHIGDKEMACLWTQKVCFHDIEQKLAEATLVDCSILITKPSIFLLHGVVQAEFYQFSGSIH